MNKTSFNYIMKCRILFTSLVLNHYGSSIDVQWADGRHKIWSVLNLSDPSIFYGLGHECTWQPTTPAHQEISHPDRSAKKNWGECKVSSRIIPVFPPL